VPAPAFDDWMRARLSDVEQGLAALLPDQAAMPQRLHEAMRYAVLDGGKRVRPLLVFAAGALQDADQDLLLRAAAALEMIHVYSLVHDDMPCMDDDALRRGKPTVHVRYDQATALLVGDALQAQAFQVLAQASGAPERKLEMIALLAEAAGSRGMCGGQAIDLESVGKPLTLEQLERMHRMKTGALLRAAVMLGALAGAALDQEQAARLSRYADAIGLAFQVVDDVLDATADSATLGKTAGKDAQDGKPTYVSILGLEQSRQLAQRLRDEAYQALLPFGSEGRYLRELADLVVQRKA